MMNSCNIITRRLTNVGSRLQGRSKAIQYFGSADSIKLKIEKTDQPLQYKHTEIFFDNTRWPGNGKKIAEPATIAGLPVWLFSKYEVAGALLGRLANNWWRKQHWQDRRRYQKRMQDNKAWTCAGGAVTVIAVTTYTLVHTERDSITGRRKLMLFDRAWMKKLADMQSSLILHKYRYQLMSTSDPTYKTVSDVMAKILRANQHLPQVKDQKWGLVILKDPTVNAYVLPNGMVFIHTGLIRTAKNLDQVGMCIGHEIAHCVQEHALELISRRCFVDLLWVLVITAVNASLSLWPAVAVTAVATAVKHLALLLPNSRKIEFEADKVGMMLSARACIDVHEGIAFWSLMEAIEADFHHDVLWWLNTHPTSRSRKIRLDGLLPEANKVRRRVSCPELPAIKKKL